MADRDLVACTEEHEMNTVLARFKKRQTAANRDTLQQACRSWKADAEYKPHNRDSFYQYLEDKQILRQLETSGT
jgi:hypothetical protein